MKLSLALPLSACLVLLLSNPALAHKHDLADKKNKTGQMFDRIDTNQDGQLQRAEFMADAEQRFKAMDLNQDGYLTKEEGREALQSMRKKRKLAGNRGKESRHKSGKMNKMLERADANQDGQVELSESLALAEQRFNAMDQNEDGYVSKSERKEKIREKRKERCSRGGKRRVTEMFDGADVNQDGKLDLDEFLAHAEQRFQDMDINGDGYLTKDEGLEAHRAMREKRKERRQQRQADAVDTE